MTYSEIYKFYLLKIYPIEENFNSIIFKEVLNGNVRFVCCKLNEFFGPRVTLRCIKHHQIMQP